MAELLIKTTNASHADQEKDRRGCYKRGDVVVVMPDGHTWGSKEGLPNFVKVKIQGVNPDVIRGLIDPQHEDDAGNPTNDDDGRPKVFRRRKWRLLVANIPAAIRNQLLTTGEVTVTPAQIRAYIRRIRDNIQFGEL